MSCARRIYLLADCHRHLNKRQNQVAGSVVQCNRPVRQKCILAMGYVFPTQTLLQGRSCQLRVDALRFLAFGPRLLDNNHPQKLRVVAAMLLAELWTLGPSDGQMQEGCAQERS